MRKEVILITGANGEMGHGLIKKLSEDDSVRIIAIDVVTLDPSISQRCMRSIQGDILDGMLLGRLVAEYEIRTIFHLASILSTRAEYNPETAHKVNVEGTLNLLRLAVEQSQWQGKSVKFLYPSSIAAYGLPDPSMKMNIPAVSEEKYLQPITMYGINKLYAEHLGRYYQFYYRQLATDRIVHTIDFRAIRFPGLISADTTPTGGTSDYAPEMIHYAAQGQPYHCFVSEETVLPFMVMPDAIKALLTLETAPTGSLSQLVYNVTSFKMPAIEIAAAVKKAFPNAEIDFKPHPIRQNIVNSWPADLDDSAARRDWGWQPDFDRDESFYNYLIPAIKSRYQ